MDGQCDACGREFKRLRQVVRVSLDPEKRFCTMICVRRTFPNADHIEWVNKASQP